MAEAEVRATLTEVLVHLRAINAVLQRLLASSALTSKDEPR